MVRRAGRLRTLADQGGQWRAWRQASLDFSKFGTRRSNRVADAMAAQVYRLASRIKPKRVAAARPRTIEDFPAELLYL